jgi:hypothetical protein
MSEEYYDVSVPSTHSELKIVIYISRMRNRTLTNREKNCRQGRVAAETRQSRGRQRIL